MALRGHVFNKQLFTSECFALFIDTFLDKNNGIVKGCGLSNTNTSVTIEDGFFCIKGRFLQEEGGSTFEVEQAIQNDIYCRLVCEIDLSQENTTAELKQAQYKILKSTTAYPVLQQEYITDDGEIYQFEFAKFKITETGIEDFQDTKTFLDFPSIYAEIRRNINTFLSQAKITTEEQIDALVADLKTYCDTAKEMLDGDVALNLINLINNLKQTKADTPRRKNITLLSSNWTLNTTTNKYEYIIEDNSITENDFANLLIHEEDKSKIKDTDDSTTENGQLIIRTSKQVTQNVSLDIVLIRTVQESEENEGGDT